MSVLKKQLDAPIPDKFVETREQAGRQLEYLSGAYVIDRMNQTFGQGNWEYQLGELRKVYEGKVTQKSGEVFATSYIATITIKATIEKNTVVFTDVGYGDGTDKANPGKAHELAVKEAVTDGVKRAAKNLGRSMGLELYFKSALPPQQSDNSEDLPPHLEQHEQEVAAREAALFDDETENLKGRPFSAPKCETCKSTMQVSKSGKHFFCPKWQDGGKHPAIKIGEVG